MESVEELCDDIALIHKSNKILDGKLVDIKRQYKTNTYEVGILTNQKGVLEQELSKKFQTSTASFKTLGDELKLNIIDKQAEIKETEGLYKHDSMDAGGFINALRGSVRPVITYVFFGLFVAIKVTALISLMDAGNDLGRSLSLIWDDATSGLFAAIISFWFGGRAVSKYVKTPV